MKTTAFLLVFVLISTLAVAAQKTPPEMSYRIFDGKGNPSSVAAIVKALENTDVVFLGEQHDDPIGHALELEIFKQAVETYSAKRKVALSMEMFERDVQIVVNEYLNGQITEAQFLASSRPWPAYKTDYRPLVELAKEKKLPVIAANAPRRYVNMVSRGGRATLNGLTKEAKAWLPPLPYGEPSDAYSKKFKALMGPSPEAQMGIDNILASQSLWDAGMSNAIANYLKANKGSLVVHLNGGFHTESRLGTVEHLLKYQPKARALVVTMRYEDDFTKFDPTKHTDLGDFVILTRPKPKTVSGGGPIQEIINRIDTNYKALHSLKSDVTMVEHNSQLETSDIYSGNVNYVTKNTTPDRNFYVRLDWTRPNAEQFLMIGDDFKLYRPKLGMVLVGKVSGLKVKGLDFLNMSKDQLKTSYTVRYIGIEELKSGVKTWHLELEPKTPSGYKTANIWVDKDGIPLQATVTEKNDDTTTVLLTNIQKNALIKTDVFRLDLRKETKIVRA